MILLIFWWFFNDFADFLLIFVDFAGFLLMFTWFCWFPADFCLFSLDFFRFCPFSFDFWMILLIFCWFLLILLIFFWFSMDLYWFSFNPPRPRVGRRFAWECFSARSSRTRPVAQNASAGIAKQKQWHIGCRLAADGDGKQVASCPLFVVFSL